LLKTAPFRRREGIEEDPMMKKFLCLAAFIGLTLTGCPDNTGSGTGGTPPTDGGTPSTAPTNGGGGETAPAASKAQDVSHVKVGQKYTYEMTNAGMKTMMVYEVKEITPAAIKCEITTMMDMGQGMNPVGPASPFDYPLMTAADTTAAAPTTTTPAPAVSFEEIEAAGKKWRCMVSTTGNVKVWLFAPNDIPTFPGTIKSEMDGQVNNMLTKVE
jgi:hypothetical protein